MLSFPVRYPVYLAFLTWSEVFYNGSSHAGVADPPTVRVSFHAAAPESA